MLPFFPVIESLKKDFKASEAINSDGLYLRSIEKVKKYFPQLLLITDVALDPYSLDGHDGLVDKKTGKILNDATLEILSQMAILQAQSGSDMIGPSDMMDGRIGFIREALDREGFNETSIMSYTAKYSSAFYGPFRDALESSPKKGDKKSYQMNPLNLKEALREAALDEEEGADILMVKPGLAYFDIIKSISEQTYLPLAGYNVSGEYAMVKFAAEKGAIDGNSAMLEILHGFKRAGCQMILTYFAKEAAELL